MKYRPNKCNQRRNRGLNRQQPAGEGIGTDVRRRSTIAGCDSNDPTKEGRAKARSLPRRVQVPGSVRWPDFTEQDLVIAYLPDAKPLGRLSVFVASDSTSGQHLAMYIALER